MACGTPVITTYGTVLLDTVSAPGVGIAVDAKDDAVLTREILRLIDNGRLREERGRASRELVVWEYDKEVYLKRTFELYDQVALVQGRGACR